MIISMITSINCMRKIPPMVVLQPWNAEATAVKNANKVKRVNRIKKRLRAGKSLTAAGTAKSESVVETTARKDLMKLVRDGFAKSEKLLCKTNRYDNSTLIFSIA